MSIVFVGFTWDLATKECDFIRENRCLTSNYGDSTIQHGGANMFIANPVLR